MATVIFPSSNLPVASQPWGRTVEKQLVDINLMVNSNEINNAARDKQLLASLNRTNATAISAQAAADAANAALADIGAVKTNIYVPGTTQINGNSIKTGTISADKITAGTLTGFTIQTAASGQRVVIGGSTASFYSASGISPAATIFGNNYGAGDFIDISAADGSYASIGAGSIVLSRSGGASLSLDNASGSAAVNITGGNLNLFGGNNLNLNGRLIMDTAYPNGYIQCIDTYGRNVQSGRIVYVASNGTYNSATSSARYKQDIQSYSVDIESFFKLRPVSFRYKMAVSQFGDNADIAHGFIAEEAAEAGMTEFVDFEPDENGNLRPDNFRYIDFTAAMYGVIKSQQETIKDLTTRLEALENK